MPWTGCASASAIHHVSGSAAQNFLWISCGRTPPKASTCWPLRAWCWTRPGPKTKPVLTAARRPQRSAPPLAMPSMVTALFPPLRWTFRMRRETRSAVLSSPASRLLAACATIPACPALTPPLPDTFVKPCTPCVNGGKKRVTQTCPWAATLPKPGASCKGSAPSWTTTSPAAAWPPSRPRPCPRLMKKTNWPHRKTRLQNFFQWII